MQLLVPVDISHLCGYFSEFICCPQKQQLDAYRAGFLRVREGFFSICLTPFPLEAA